MKDTYYRMQRKKINKRNSHMIILAGIAAIVSLSVMAILAGIPFFFRALGSPVWHVCIILTQSIRSGESKLIFLTALAEYLIIVFFAIITFLIIRFYLIFQDYIFGKVIVNSQCLYPRLLRKG